MAKISQSDNPINAIITSTLKLDEFIPIVQFESNSFGRLDVERLIEDTEEVTLSEHIDESKRTYNLHSLTSVRNDAAMLLPFKVSRGSGTWDDDGYIKVSINPPHSDITMNGNDQFTVRYGDEINLELLISGNEEREFYLDFFANDDLDDYNSGEIVDIHCGRMKVKILGSSEVGYRLISNIDLLPDAPADYDYPAWNTADSDEIRLSQQQANLYNNCEGVCYATSESRAQQAYIDETGSGVVNLTVSNRNIDHRIAATQGTNDPHMGYGAGGPFVRAGVGETVDNIGTWAGELKRGALLQRWNTTDTTNLYGSGGHSVIFRDYTYDDDGNINGLSYTDYHGGIRSMDRATYETGATILGVNILDN